MTRLDPQVVWDYLDGKSDYWPAAELTVIGCGALRSWNVKGHINEDVLAEAHMRFWEKCALGKLRRDVAPGTFFTVILRTVLLGEAKKARRPRKVIASSPIVEDVEPLVRNDAGDNIDGVDYDDTRSFVEGVANDTLGSKVARRYMRVMEGASTREVGEEEGVSAQTVHWTVNNARDKMLVALNGRI